MIDGDKDLEWGGVTIQKVPWDSRWKEVPGFPNYWISQYGQVFNMKRLHLMKLYRNTHNVLCVRMYRKDATQARGFSRSVGKLVRIIFGEEMKERDIYVY